MTDQTIQFYSDDAENYWQRIKNIDISVRIDQFCSYLPKQPAHILDVGCGPGRDARDFIKRGHTVTPIEPAVGMLPIAERICGIRPLQLTAQEISAIDAFDGIWMNASLLHVPHSDWALVFKNIHRAGKSDAAVYISTKHGNSARTVGDRIFYDADLAILEQHCASRFKIVESWTDEDGGLGSSPSNMWQKIIAIKL